MWYKVWLEFVFFFLFLRTDFQLVQQPFVEKIIFSTLICLCIFVKNQLFIICVSLFPDCRLYSVILMFLSLFLSLFSSIFFSSLLYLIGFCLDFYYFLSSVYFHLLFFFWFLRLNLQFKFVIYLKIFIWLPNIWEFSRDFSVLTSSLIPLSSENVLCMTWIL